MISALPATQRVTMFKWVYRWIITIKRSMLHNSRKGKTQQNSVNIHGPLTRYVKNPGCACAGNAPTRQIRYPDMHHGTFATHVLLFMPGSLSRVFLWSWWRGKRSRCMRNPQFYVSGKKPMGYIIYNALVPMILITDLEFNSSIARFSTKSSFIGNQCQLLK